MTEGYYLSDGTEMYYKIIGEGIPMLLVHGWAINHSYMLSTMEPIFNELTTPIKRIYIDIPGMGLSKPGKIKNGDGIISILIDFMNELSPDDNYYACGNSFGSVIVRGLAAKCPQRVKGLILIAPAEDKRNIVDNEGICTIDREFLNSLSEEERRPFMRMQANLTPEVYSRFKAQVEASMKINENNNYLKTTLKGSFSFDINKLIIKNKYKGDVLILTGKYDIAVGYKNQFEWLNIFKNASYFAIDGAGHNINVDKPEIFNSIITGWIKEYVR